VASESTDRACELVLDVADEDEDATEVRPSSGLSS
jgi:hypothetical protein